MNIAIIGSGGREHAICQKIKESNESGSIYCFPGNAGTSSIATNINIDFLDFKIVYRAIKVLKIDLVIVGPEEPLVKGIVDYLSARRVKVFGPKRFAAQLEGSKAFMKSLCKRNNIPTANFKICNNIKEVKKFLDECKLPIVVKADGLAAGKGVTICKSKIEVFKVSAEIFNGKFTSSKKAVLEEFLTGEEASYFITVDKNNFSFLGSAQDHKRVGNKDKGPNTGGMGAYSPAPIINKLVEKKIIDKIIKPTLKALKKKCPYTGFLYVGLMIKNNEPHLIEYNVRMGDPECQVILPRLKTSLLKIINFSVKNKLNKLKINWTKKKSMTIVLCSKGYPGKYKKNVKIENLNKVKLNKNSFIYHAGTNKFKNSIFSSGGRVLNISSMGSNFLNIRSKIIEIIKIINWKNGFYRSDIGWRVIKNK
tara:strand:- start:294 stop:1559 length:1266 start_codon:yes stop_codon:yes gene_type:complete